MAQSIARGVQTLMLRGGISQLSAEVFYACEASAEENVGVFDGIAERSRED